MRFKLHQCIEVRHQLGVRRYACGSFVDAARADGWDYEEIPDMAAAIDAFGAEEDVPAELADLLKKGPAIAITEPGAAEQYYVTAAGFDAEAAALDWLAHDLNRLIVIDDTDDARYYAEKYHDHEWPSVRVAAEKILREAADGYIEEA